MCFKSSHILIQNTPVSINYSLIVNFLKIFEFFYIFRPELCTIDIFVTFQTISSDVSSAD